MGNQTKLGYRAIPGILGRVLSIRSPNILYVGYKHRIYRTVDFGDNWQLVGILPASLICKCSGWFRPLQRLLRYELRSFAVSGEDLMLAASREGVFWGQGEKVRFERTQLPNCNRAIYSPMSITCDSKGRFIWGEYKSNPVRDAVGIYVSLDGGKSHRLIHEFAAGDVRHVHQIIEDPFEDGYWVLTGDEDRESGIGWLSRDFKDFDWLVHGSQRYRAVVAFPFEDYLVYATDTEKDYNFIYRCDRATGKTEKICDIPGSCIYGCRFGKWYVISTTVERFHKFKTNLATLWVSQDGLKWQQVWEAQKDIWPKKYFQYGSIVLPRSGWDCDEIVFSGQALKGVDNKVYVAKLVEQG